MTSPQFQSTQQPNGVTREIRLAKQPSGRVQRHLWQGKTAVICGGSQGLGLSIAEELIRQKIAHLILIARNPEQLSQAVEHLQSLVNIEVNKPIAADLQSTESENELSANVAVSITSVIADMTDLGSAQAAAQKISSFTTEVDLVIQAIGSSDRGTIVGLSRERLHELIDTNVVTSLHAIQQFSHLIASPGGVIVLIGSLSSLFAPRFLGGYSIAKHGLVALAQQSRLELSEKGIHVSLCCPGPIARPDAGLRYSNANKKEDLPPEATMPGGGAKVKGLCPQRLARDILQAAGRRDLLIIRPKKAWWLRLLSILFPGIGERILRSKTS